MSKRVEFVDYTGAYPCLCFSEVTLKIDGKIVEFCKYKDDVEETGKPYLRLSSGGEAWVDTEGESFVRQAPWEIDLDSRYAELEDEILEVINNNIPWGCCGGCI